MTYKKNWLFTRIGWAWPLQWWARGVGAIKIDTQSVTVYAFPFSTSISFSDLENVEVQNTRLILHHHGKNVPVVIIGKYGGTHSSEIVDELRKRKVKILGSK